MHQWQTKQRYRVDIFGSPYLHTIKGLAVYNILPFVVSIHEIRNGICNVLYVLGSCVIAKEKKGPEADDCKG